MCCCSSSAAVAKGGQCVNWKCHAPVAIVLDTLFAVDFAMLLWQKLRGMSEKAMWFCRLAPPPLYASTHSNQCMCVPTLHFYLRYFAGRCASRQQLHGRAQSLLQDKGAYKSW